MTAGPVVDTPFDFEFDSTPLFRRSWHTDVVVLPRRRRRAIHAAPMSPRYRAVVVALFSLCHRRADVASFNRFVVVALFLPSRLRTIRIFSHRSFLFCVLVLVSHCSNILYRTMPFGAMKT